MIVSGITLQEAQVYVDMASERYFGGNLKFRSPPQLQGRRITFSLRVAEPGKPGARVILGRRTTTACAHVFGRVIQVILENRPDAKIHVATWGNFDYLNYKMLLPWKLDQYLDQVGEELKPCFCTQELLSRA